LGKVLEMRLGRLFSGKPLIIAAGAAPWAQPEAFPY
jgi:hypothetical protein